MTKHKGYQQSDFQHIAKSQVKYRISYGQDWQNRSQTSQSINVWYSMMLKIVKKELQFPIVQKINNYQIQFQQGKLYVENHIYLQKIILNYIKYFLFINNNLTHNFNVIIKCLQSVKIVIIIISLEEFSKQNEVEILSYKVTFLKNINVLEIDPVQSNFTQQRVINNHFLSKHLHTCNSFIQKVQKQSIQTAIATMGVPFAPELNEINFKNQDQVYNFITTNLKDSFMIQEIQHNSSTVCISFCPELDSFCISSGTQTIVCYNEKDIDLFQEPMHERPRQVASQFFNFFNRMPIKQQNNFIQDLINRSLIGCYNLKKYIEWFAIVEHYSEQRMMDPITVKNFLNHYKLLSAQTQQTSCTPIKLQQYFYQIHNQSIEQFHDYYKGKTLYFWKDNTFLGCCFIPNRQYSILNQLRLILLNKEKYLNKQEPYQYLSKFNLNDQDLEFYKKYTDRMLEIPETIKNKYQFSQLSINTLNIINQELSNQQQQKNNIIPNSIQQTIIVVIPIGILGMGYEKLCNFIQKAVQRVQIISKPDQINEQNQLYFYEKICNLKELEQINKQLKQLSLNLKTIALLPECNFSYNQKNSQFNFPFSFNFIMYCLLSVLNDKNQVKEVINQLKEFQNQKLTNFCTDYIVYCRFMPKEKETDDLYSELVEQDFQAALKSENDQLIESLSQYKETLKNIGDNFLKKETKRVLQSIQEKSQLILRKSVQFQIEKNNNLQYGLFIEKPDWDAIDNFVKSCLEIIVQQYPNDSGINRMYHQYDNQFKSQDAVYMKMNHPYMQTRQLQEKIIDAKVSIGVIIVDGIIMLHPQELGLNLLQDIPIYSHNIDSLKSNKVSEQLKIDVRKMQRQNIEERNIYKKQVDFNRKSWDAYIVKFTPINIKLVGKQIN
ncbi:unnamed protein product [Paramecium primaurelia]|uniref:Uncharacterized protein n=1 Tax=Paramecium primaurelia TaxID=5886 RepID=A0A8S1LTC3_PARPR|nr:unnamed protein product [Paramecium primaurelia]